VNWQDNFKVFEALSLSDKPLAVDTVEGSSQKIDDGKYYKIDDGKYYKTEQSTEVSAIVG